MRIKYLNIRFEPLIVGSDLVKGRYQLTFEAQTNEQRFNHVEIIEESDFESRFDQIFERAKHYIKELVEDYEASRTRSDRVC